MLIATRTSVVVRRGIARLDVERLSVVADLQACIPAQRHGKQVARGNIVVGWESPGVPPNRSARAGRARMPCCSTLCSETG